LLAAVGGPGIVLLTGVTLGAAAAGAPVVLDGLAASLPGVIATWIEPGVQGHLLAGHVSRERAHALVLRELGLEPLLSLRLRSGEGVGACLAASLLLQGLSVRRVAARSTCRGAASPGARARPGSTSLRRCAAIAHLLKEMRGSGRRRP